VLSRYAAVDPKDWVFTTNAYGRPSIVNTYATDGGLTFNVSHTLGLIVLGVAKGRALGVDAENFATRYISSDLANHYFSAEEVAALHEAPHHQQRSRFFEYWTLKESYVKARGQGFSLPLDTFSFQFAGDHAYLTINPELGDDSSRWQLWQLRPSSEHLVAVCAEKLNAPSPRLVVRETTPTVRESVCQVGTNQEQTMAFSAVNARARAVSRQ
jgi:4'-phosphopantetheinyl transferase